MRALDARWTKMGHVSRELSERGMRAGVDEYGTFGTRTERVVRWMRWTNGIDGRRDLGHVARRGARESRELSRDGEECALDEDE